MMTTLMDQTMLQKDGNMSWMRLPSAHLLQCPPAEIKDWAALRTRIKEDLKKKSKILTLSAINQLMILSNFATLRLKGAS